MLHRITKLRLNNRITTGSAGTSNAAPILPTIAGLVAWYDASLGITKDGGNLVSTWADQSGNGVTITSSGSNRPLWRSSESNGYPAVDFSNTRFMQSASGLGTSFPISALGSISAFAVTKVFTGQTSCVWDMGGVNKSNPSDFSVASGRIDGLNWSQYHEYDSPGVTYSFSVSGLTAISGASALYYCTSWRRRNPTKAHTYTYAGANNTQTYLFNPSDGGNAVVNLGRDSAGALFYQGAICEFLYYNSNLLGANLSGVINYLVTKYGVT